MNRVWGRTLTVGLAAAFAAHGQLRLEFAERPRLLDCGPASDVPCFRLAVNIVDETGAPAGVPLPPQEELASHITVTADRVASQPFHATAGENATSQRGRVALVLIDASGSMLEGMSSGETRFQAAQSAAYAFLDGFEEGKDRVAVVPFESRDVVSRIRAAEFAGTVEEARAQIGALAQPRPSGNTALYSAIDAGLTALEERTRDGEAESMLVVMTDGRNDVQPGDDPGLLGGEGLELVSKRVAESGVQVIAVGLGDARSLDSEALGRVSSRHFVVADQRSLGRVFSFAREMLINRLRVTLRSPWGDRASLAGKALPFRMRLELPNGQAIESGETVWSPPQMGTPVFEGRCEEAEIRAALARPADGLTQSGWWSAVRPLLVFAGLGATLFALWSWVPRLIWPERYVGYAPVVASRGRWAHDARSLHATAAPTGFRKGRGGVQARGGADRTVVMPNPAGRERGLR